MQKAHQQEQGLPGRSRRSLKRVRRFVVVAGVIGMLGWASSCSVWKESSGTLLAWGRFHSVAHLGEGVAALYALDNGKTQLHLLDLRTTYRPDLQVLLISAPDAFDNDRVRAADIVVLGPLKAQTSDQVYDLPEDIDLGHYRAVTIWLPQYEVNFTTAPLRPPELPPTWRQGRPILRGNSGAHPQ